MCSKAYLLPSSEQLISHNTDVAALYEVGRIEVPNRAFNKVLLPEEVLPGNQTRQLNKQQAVGLYFIPATRRTGFPFIIESLALLKSLSVIQLDSRGRFSFSCHGPKSALSTSCLVLAIRDATRCCFFTKSLKILAVAAKGCENQNKLC